MNDRMTYLRAYGASYGKAIGFMIAMPLAAAVLIGVEFAQHVVEVKLGMLQSFEGAQAAEQHPARLMAGTFKQITTNMVAFFAIRYALFGNDAAAAARPDARAMLLYLPVILFQLAYGAVITLAVPVEHGMTAMLAGFLLLPLLVRWSTGAAVGKWISPLASARSMLPHLPFAAALTVGAMLPLMVLHYGLFFGAVGKAPTVVWGLMALDSLVVGLLIPVAAIANVIAALRPGRLKERDVAAA